MSVIFISYRRKDVGGHAGRLHEDLKRRYGGDAVFFDIDSLPGGVNFRQRIHDALEASDIALVLIGERWAAPISGSEEARIDRAEDLVRQEVAGALEHEGVAVVPVLVEDASLPPASDLPEDLSPLRGLQICRLRNSEWKSDFRRIAKAIDTTSGNGAPQRLLQSLRHHPLQAAAALLVAALVVLAMAALAGSGGGGGGGGEGCVNQFIAKDARAELTVAAGSSRPAEEGTVYYGTCGSKAYALATFPNGSDGVFVQSGLHWVDLGPIAAEKCVRVPPELLQIWRQDDC